MVKISSIQTYEILKSSFRDGIEFKTQPCKSYVQKRLSYTDADRQSMTDVVSDLYKRSKLPASLSKGVEWFELDWNKFGEMAALRNAVNRILQDGRTKLQNAFVCGKQNPDLCIMAWYDALAEHVIAKAESLVGEEAPVPVIQKELNLLSKRLSHNFDFMRAKSAVFDALKTMYPKTYKTRLKLIEQGYNKKIETAIDNIVRTIVHGA